MKPPLTRSLVTRSLLTAAIAFCFGLLGASLAGHMPQGLGPSSRPNPDYRLVQFRERVDRMLSEEMHLSTQQKQRVELIDHNYTLDYNLALADLHASNSELAAALANDMSLNDDAKTAIREIEVNVGQMQTSTVNYIVDLRKVLTPDQQKIFDGRIIADIM